jgi:hypothetical protein
VQTFDGNFSQHKQSRKDPALLVESASKKRKINDAEVFSYRNAYSGTITKIELNGVMTHGQRSNLQVTIGRLMSLSGLLSAFLFHLDSVRHIYND